jgi:riboflavin kinase/FMN adenylyltransferase
VRDAAIVLGRPYEIESTVEQGARRGRALGFPTINLANNGGLLPADGVYLGEAELPDGSSRTAAISVGTNPTFAPLPKSCEAYLLDWSGGDDEYGWTVRLRFTMWLRDQIAFSTVEALRDQLARDIDRVRSLTSPTLAGATA